jgi:hypothetical protein
MNDVLDLNYSNQAQQSANAQPATGSDAIDIGENSTNEGEVVINTETEPTFGRDQLSFGISGGSVGMGASHEAKFMEMLLRCRESRVLLVMPSILLSSPRQWGRLVNQLQDPG